MRTNAHVYVMEEAETGLLKVGHSKYPYARLRDLSTDVGSIAVRYTTDLLEHAEKTEMLAHRILRKSGCHIKGEWFSCGLDEAVDAIQTAIRVVQGLEPPPPIIAKEKKDFNMKVEVEFLQQIDRIRISRFPIKSRPETVRDLVREAASRARTVQQMDNRK